MKYISFFLLLFSLSCALNKKTKQSDLFTGDAIGCGNFMVFKLSEDNKEYLSIALNASKVNWQASQIYSLGKVETLEVKRKQFESEVHQLLCNDVISSVPPVLIKEEFASAGTIKIKLSDDALQKQMAGLSFTISIELRNISFQEVEVDYLLIENVNVGWLPG